MTQKSYYDLTKSSCAPCPEDCATCNTDTSCLSCKNPIARLDNGKCRVAVCPDGAHLDESGSCHCPAGMYLSKQGCSDCSFGCLACASLLVCTNCRDDFLLKSGKCITKPAPSQESSLDGSRDVQKVCDANCKTCSPDGVCSACSNGFYLPELGTSCLQCESGMKTAEGCAPVTRNASTNKSSSSAIIAVAVVLILLASSGLFFFIKRKLRTKTEVGVLV